MNDVMEIAKGSNRKTRKKRVFRWVNKESSSAFFGEIMEVCIEFTVAFVAGRRSPSVTGACNVCPQISLIGN